ncbi:MAG: hypothetical protein F6K11_28860 [Leptolyngbya sp. SIO3F4]|nr:hypothetical protein [Leptolyngbya sp. SIO3F4]
MPKNSLTQSRNTLIYLFITLLILDAILIYLSKDLWAIGRILFTALIMYFTLQGHRWAKWMLVGILSLVVIALVGLLAALREQLSPILSIGSVTMAILCCMIMAYLIGNHQLQQYLTSKRQRG